MDTKRRTKPNILFVFADQLRGCSLGHVGQEPVLTPHLDAFAAQGRRFMRAVSNAPLCCPMRASVLTGLHPLSHGVVGNDILLRTDAPSLAKSLKGAGYQTAYIGKWHLDGIDRGAFTPPGPRRQGFDYWAAANCNHSYYESYYYADSPEPVWSDRYEPAVQTDLAIDYLKGHAGANDPFCLVLSWGPPHCPYDHVPASFCRMYDAAPLPVRPNAVNPNRDILAGYYAHITALDHHFGRLLTELDRQGLADNTLVVFTSDHGDMLYSQNRGWKSKPWHESVIVPFIARWPGRIAPGSVETAPFGLVDTMPTLCAIAEAGVPGEVEGRALPHMVLGGEGARPSSTPIYLHMPAVPQSFGMWRGVITETHTYARFRENPWVLYDDRADPYQMRNLAFDPSAAALRATMDGDLNAWMDCTGDTFEHEFEIAARLGIPVSDKGIPPLSQKASIGEEMRRRAGTRAERMARE